MATIYVSPTGSGSKSGASAANALSVTSLDKAIQLAGPGGTVLMLADVGTYSISSPIIIAHGGTEGAPVTVKGVDSFGAEMKIQINGTRPVDWIAGMAAGNETFKLLAGANYLVFDNMSFANVGTAFRAGADITNIVIQDMYADNVQRFFEDYLSGTNPSATVSFLTIRNVEVHGFSKGVVRLQYDSHDILIENVYGDSERQDGDGIAIGVLLDGTVHAVTIRNTTMENAQASNSSSASTYWNGDGFATERGVYDVTFIDTVARGNADGGYDIKSTDTTLIRAVAEGNARNFRLWGEATLIDPIGLNPHKYGGTGGQYQIQILNGAKVTVTGGSFSDSGSSTRVVSNDAGESITFSNTTFVHAATGYLTTGTGIFGINPALVYEVQATGAFSSNGAALLAALTGSSGTTDTSGSSTGGTDTSSGSTGSTETSSGSTGGTDTSSGGSTGGTTGGTTDTSGGSTGGTIDTADAYQFAIPAGSGRHAVNLGKNDRIVTNKQIYDSNNDGIITFGPGGILNIEQTKTKVGDQQIEISGAQGLRYLGVSGGAYVYADSSVRPAGAIEGTVSNDILKGTSKNDVFFFDNALDVNFGSDSIRNVAAADRLVTTQALGDPDNDGLVNASAQAFLLGTTSAEGQAKLLDSSGKAITSLKLEGTTVVDGVTYYSYSPVLSTLALSEASAGTGSSTGSLSGATSSGGTTSPSTSDAGAGFGTPTYQFSIPTGSGRHAVNLGKDGTIATNKQIYDSNNDGIITFESGGILDIEKTRRTSGDQILEITGAQSLRYLGTTNGLYAYADAAVRPSGSIEGTVANDSLKGTSKNDIFFFDNALDVNLGSDTIKSFSATDRLVTTQQLSDPNNDGVISANASQAFQLGASAAEGQVKLTSTSGATISSIEFDGTTVVDGVTYYIYSMPGGVDVLSF